MGKSRILNPTQGLDGRKNFSVASGRGRSIFLDIPFYRTHKPEISIATPRIRCEKLVSVLCSYSDFSCKRVASSPLNPFSSSTNAAPSVRTDSDLIKYLTNDPFGAIERHEIRPPALVAALPQGAIRPPCRSKFQHRASNLQFATPSFSYCYEF